MEQTESRNSLFPRNGDIQTIGQAGTEGGFRVLNQRAVLSGLLACIGYYLGTKVGLALTFHPHPVSVMWPSNAILLTALLFNPPRVWWFLLLCVFPAHLITQLQNHIPPTMSVC